MTTDTKAELLCGHWTFFQLSDDVDLTARCDLPAGHDGMHKFWWNPASGDAYSWADIAERHERRTA